MRRDCPIHRVRAHVKGKRGDRTLLLDDPQRAQNREFVAGDYLSADLATYPWVVPYERQGQDLGEFPNLKRWFGTIRARPAVVRAYELAKEINVQPTVSERSFAKHSVRPDRGAHRAVT